MRAAMLLDEGFMSRGRGEQFNPTRAVFAVGIEMQKPLRPFDPLKVRPALSVTVPETTQEFLRLFQSAGDSQKTRPCSQRLNDVRLTKDRHIH